MAGEKNILLKFTAENTPLEETVAALNSIAAADKKVADQAGKSESAAAGRNQAIAAGAEQASNSIATLSKNMQSLDKVVSGGSVVSGIRQIGVELNKVASMKVANVPFVDTLNRNIASLVTNVKGASGEVGKLPVAFDKIKPKAADASYALTNLTRIVQDLPYGLQGIANNIGPAQEALTGLIAKSGGTQEALGALGAALTGPAGIAFAVSAIVSLIVKFGDKIGEVFPQLTQYLDELYPNIEKNNKKQAEFNKTLEEANGIIVELAKSYSSIYATRTNDAQKALDLAQAQGKSEGDIYAARQKLITATRLQNVYQLESTGLSEEDVKYNESKLQILNEQLQAILSQASVNRALNKDQLAQVANLQTQISGLKTITDAGRTALDNIKQANNDAQIAAAERTRQLYEEGVKSATALVEARIALTTKGSKAELDAQIAAIHARVEEEKKLNVNLQPGERAKLENEAIRQIEDLRFDFEKRQLQDVRSAVQSRISLAKEGSREEYDLRVADLQAAQAVELKVQGQTNAQKNEINAKFYKQALDLANAFALKQGQNEVNTRIAQAQQQVAELEYNNTDKNNGELLALKEKLIDDQAELEALSVTYTEKNEELRLAKTKAIYSKALAAKKQLEDDKTRAEIQNIVDTNKQELQDDIDNNNRQLQSVALTEGQKMLLRKKNSLDQISINDLELKALERLHDLQLISDKEYYQKKKKLKKEQADEEAKIDNDNEIKRQKIFAASVDLFQTLTSGYADIRRGQLEKESEENQNLYDNKLITEKEYQTRSKDIKRREAEADKQNAVFNIAIATAQNIAKAFPNVALEILAGVLGAAQTAIVLAKPTGYKKGKIRIPGPGTETSDSIHALLSRNESVINAKATNENALALAAINEHRYEKHLMDYELPKLLSKMSNLRVPILPQAATSAGAQAQQIDWNKAGKAIAKHMPKTGGAKVILNNRGLWQVVDDANSQMLYTRKKLNR